jgi:Zn-dependent M28 family amino/carboxypeptidase
MATGPGFAAWGWAVASAAVVACSNGSTPLPRDAGSSSSGGSSGGSTSSGGGSSSGGSSSGGSSSGGPSSGGSSSGGSSGGGSSSSGSSSGGATAPTDAAIGTIVANISSANLASTIQTLVAFGTRNSCSTATGATQGIVAARDWIKAQFDASGGLTTSLYSFQQTGCTQSFMRHDVVAVLPGKGHPSRVVVVGGHYDSRTLNVADGTSPAPGANDSGSQTAVVLELARVLAGYSFDATLVFVAFAGEEQGLVGSKALAANIASVVPGAQVVAMLNCDIVGGDSTMNDAAALQQFRLYSPGTPREVGATTPDGTTDDTSPSRGLMRYVATWGSVYVPSMTIVPKLREDRPGRGGDHESFIANSYPGVRFIETNESPNAGTVGSHQHSPNDLFTYVTPDYTARIAQIVAAVAASLARAPDAPGGITGAGTAATPALTWTAPTTGPVDHYVVAARAVTENFYRTRVRLSASQTTGMVTPAELGVDPSSPYFVSVAAVDAAGHESLFAYPEYRCDTGGCVVPAGALNITATN